MSGIIDFRARLAQAAAFIAANVEANVHPVTNEFREIVLAGYNWLGRFINIGEVNPLSQQYTEQELASATAVVVGTAYFPSSAGMAMGGYKDLGTEFSITTGANAGDTMTLTLEASDDTTNPPAAGSWVTISKAGYDLNANALGAASWVATSVGVALTATYIVDWDNLNCRRFRFSVTAGVHDGVLTRLHIRQKAL
jgi:hypothetical protein